VDTNTGILAQLDLFVYRSISHVWSTDVACAARLTPLNKAKEQDVVVDIFGNRVEGAQAGPMETRPIAAGETLLHLVGKTLARHPTIRRACQEFHPPQVGVGVPSACPLMAMGVQQLANKMTTDGHTDFGFLLLNCRNGFNSVKRSKLLANV